VQIFDALGKMIQPLTVNEPKMQFNLVNQPVGVYYVKIRQNNEIYDVIRIIKSK